jgi:serine protease Do
MSTFGMASPAAAAGFEPGDIVISFNNQPVDLSSDLPPIVGATPVGGKVPVEVIRNGNKLNLSVEIGELPASDDIQLSSGGPATPGAATDNRLGLAVTDLTDQQRSQLELEDHGVLVQKIVDGVAEAVYRAGAQPSSVSEVRRVLGLPLQMRRVDADDFERLLRLQY